MGRLFALGLLVLVVGSVPARAEAPSEADGTAIRGTIQAQLDAFNRDDGSAAYGYAAPGIKVIFPTVQIFMTMVRDGYAPVYRSREVEFREGEVIGPGLVLQQALIVGADGTVVLALYTMELGDDGIWRIAGCRLAQSNEAGA